AGVGEICIVVPPREIDTYRAAVADAPAKLVFVEQPPAPGYASALQSAGEFTGTDPFLHLVGDHVYIGPKEKGWAARLVEVAEAQQCSVSAVQSTHESLISRFGVVGGTPVSGDLSLYKVDAI